MTWLEQPHHPLTSSPALALALALSQGSLVPLDPGHMALDVCEDGRRLHHGAADAPADYAHLDPGVSLTADQGSPESPCGEKGQSQSMSGAKVPNHSGPRPEGDP